jgi:hypothetical protein
MKMVGYLVYLWPVLGDPGQILRIKDVLFNIATGGTHIGFHKGLLENPNQDDRIFGSDANRFVFCVHRLGLTFWTCSAFHCIPFHDHPARSMPFGTTLAAQRYGGFHGQRT